jgi:hypothetical protein
MRDISSQPSYSGSNRVGSGTPATGKRDKKSSKPDEFTAMEHLAKAQVSYLRTVSELREKVTKLEAYPLLNMVQRNLSKLGEAITDQLSQIDKRTLTVIAMGLYIAWPRIAPTIRASIKSALVAILDKLIINSKIGHWLQLARVRIAAILVSVVTLLQPPTAVTVGANG